MGRVGTFGGSVCHPASSVVYEAAIIICLALALAVALMHEYRTTETIYGRSP